MSVPKYEKTAGVVDRGPSARLWMNKSSWDKNISPANGSRAQDDFVPFTGSANAGTTTSYNGFVRNSTTTDFTRVAGQHGILRLDYNTTAGDNAIYGAQIDQYIDPDLIDEVVFEVLMTVNEDDELFADGGTVDFIGFSSATDPTNSSDGVNASTTETADNHLGLSIAADGDVSLVTKPNGSTAAATVIKADFATITKGSGVYHKFGVKVKRNGDGSFLVFGSVDGVLHENYGSHVAAASIGTTAMRPVLSSRTPGGASGQVPASNVDWYECLNDQAVENVNA